MREKANEKKLKEKEAEKLKKRQALLKQANNDNNADEIKKALDEINEDNKNESNMLDTFKNDEDDVVDDLDF